MIRLSHNSVTIVDVKIANKPYIYINCTLQFTKATYRCVYVRKENNKRGEIRKWWAETTRYIRNIEKRESWLSIFFTINLNPLCDKKKNLYPLCVIQPHILVFTDLNFQIPKNTTQQKGSLFSFLLLVLSLYMYIYIH